MTPNLYVAELHRQRAGILLDMYESLLATLSVQCAYAKMLREAARFTDPAEKPLRAAGYYQPTDGEQELERGRRALLRAAGVPLRTFQALPRYGKEQSDILLRGAAALGVETSWPGVTDEHC